MGFGRDHGPWKRCHSVTDLIVTPSIPPMLTMSRWLLWSNISTTMSCHAMPRIPYLTVAYITCNVTDPSTTIDHRFGLHLDEGFFLGRHCMRSERTDCRSAQGIKLIASAPLNETRDTFLSSIGTGKPYSKSSSTTASRSMTFSLISILSLRPLSCNSHHISIRVRLVKF